MKNSLRYTILFCSLIAFTKVQAQEKILVQFFMHTTCPISQKYTLTINGIAKKFQNQPVQFELIFLDIIKASQLKKVKDFVQEYQIQVPYKTLKNTEDAQQMGVKVTPEVLVTYNNQIQYQGAIDDWFIDWGKNRKQPEQFYLINAINSLLSNQTVWIKKTNAIGCLIELKNKKQLSQNNL
jgi:thiol-disulfide isomerase/thioredoxin